MGKPTGFIEYRRASAPDRDALERVHDFEFIHGCLDDAARKQQAARCMDCGVPFCQTKQMLDGVYVGCPLNNLIPEWNQQLWSDNLPMALDRLLETNCFPEFTGYVCPAPCERACSCRKAGLMDADAANDETKVNGAATTTKDVSHVNDAVGAAVTINDNERYIIDCAFEQGLIQPHAPQRRSGKTVAVVGSGPAGLTVAALLNQRGHSVTVYERDQRPGGLLVYGIPNMKLPKTVVARRISLMQAEGVRFECGTDVGKDISLPTLASQFDAVVLAIGAQNPREVKFDGHAAGVCYALDYLSSASRAYLHEAACDPLLNAAGKNVAVVGAGDTANDCIATALRQGARDIVQLIRRAASDYGPATDYAHQETDAQFGHDIRRFETTVSAVHGNVSGCDQGDSPSHDAFAASVDDADAAESGGGHAGAAESGGGHAGAAESTRSNRLVNKGLGAGQLESITLSTPEGPKDIPAELLIVASGFTGAETYATHAVDLSEYPNVFEAGDMVTGASLVASAMAHARKTARATDIFLTGYSTIL